jgi:hypothetical protein
MEREPDHSYGRELSAERVNELGRRALDRFDEWSREMFRLQIELVLHQRPLPASEINGAVSIRR